MCRCIVQVRDGLRVAGLIENNCGKSFQVHKSKSYTLPDCLPACQPNRSRSITGDNRYLSFNNASSSSSAVYVYRYPLFALVHIHYRRDSMCWVWCECVYGFVSGYECGIWWWTLYILQEDWWSSWTTQNRFAIHMWTQILASLCFPSIHIYIYAIFIQIILFGAPTRIICAWSRWFC